MKPPPGIRPELRFPNGGSVGSRSRGQRSRLECDWLPHRQHPWFTVHLPRYLAVMQADTVASATCVDNEIVSEVRCGPPRAHRMASLQQQWQECGSGVPGAKFDPKRSSGVLGMISDTCSDECMRCRMLLGSNSRRS